MLAPPRIPDSRLHNLIINTLSPYLIILACVWKLWLPSSVPRKLIILLCCLNGLLGIFLLWFILTPSQSNAPFAVERPGPSEAPAHTDTALWEMAMAAGTAQEAYRHLRGLPEDRNTAQKMNQQIGTLVERAPLPFAEWPFHEGLLRSYGDRAQAVEDLSVLARIATQTEQALTLRDLAFRVFIQNFERFEGANPEAAYELIDTLYEEASSLAGTALQAEAFLSESGMGRAGRKLAGADADDMAGDTVTDAESANKSAPYSLAKRSEAMLRDPSAIESNRLAAVGVLFDLEARPHAEDLRVIFESTDSEQLKFALLRLMESALRNDAQTDTTVPGSAWGWLTDYCPSTPNVEREIYRLLGK